MRIVYHIITNRFLGYTPIGGVEFHTAELAFEIKKKVNSISVICSNDAAFDSLAAKLSNMGVDVYRLRPLATAYASQLVGDFYRLCKTLIKLRPDVVHIQRAVPSQGKWSILAARLAGAKLVIATDHDPPRFTGEWSRHIEKVANRFLGGVIVVSDHSKKLQLAFGSQNQSKIHRIHNGINLRKFPLERFPRDAIAAMARKKLGIPECVPVIGAVARLVEEKGIANLLEIAAQLSQEHPDLHVLISGEGPARDALELRATELGLGERTFFVGFYPEIEIVMQAIDVFVLPTRWEAFGLVVAEAMASYIPVVTTTVGGLPEVVEDGVTGFLTEVGDVRGMANAVRRLLNDEDLRRKMGQAGRKRIVCKFSTTVMASNTLELYERLLDGSR